jgi:hypothetical protein
VTVIAVVSGRHAPAVSLCALTILLSCPFGGVNEPVNPAAVQEVRASATVFPVRSGTTLQAADGAGVEVGAAVTLGVGTGLGDGDGVPAGGDVRFAVGRGVATDLELGVAVTAPDGDVEPALEPGPSAETSGDGAPDPTAPPPPPDGGSEPTADSLAAEAGTSLALSTPPARNGSPRTTTTASAAMTTSANATGKGGSDRRLGGTGTRPGATAARAMAPAPSPVSAASA